MVRSSVFSTGIQALLATALVGSMSLPAHAGTGKSGKVKGRVNVSAGSAEGVVVTLEGVPESKPAALKASPEIRQKNKQFGPFLTVVPKGTRIEFPNDDKIHHNVFSVSKPKRFDLGLYKSGVTKSVKFRKSGVVDVYCNIHPEMVAKVKVVDTRYYAVTGKDGRFVIKDVPPGTYPIVAWQAYGEEYRGTIKVKAGGATPVSIKLKSGKKPRRHMRKDGTPYGRYK